MKSISIIIPTFNESEIIEETIKRIRQLGDFEIIVCDGGSTDDTFEVSKKLAEKALSSNPCRAHQMNQGARIATGTHLVFLHADTQLPKNFENEVFTLLDNPRIVMGAFKLEIDSSKLSLKIIEFLTNQRSKILKLPYGDQAFFVKKEIFAKLGMFKEIPIMEDFEFARRARKNGGIVISQFSTITSARRWDKLGAIKTTFKNQTMIFGYFVGIKIERLAKFYRNK